MDLLLKGWLPSSVFRELQVHLTGMRWVLKEYLWNGSEIQMVMYPGACTLFYTHLLQCWGIKSQGWSYLLSVNFLWKYPHRHTWMEACLLGESESSWTDNKINYHKYIPCQLALKHLPFKQSTSVHSQGLLPKLSTCVSSLCYLQHPTCRQQKYVDIWWGHPVSLSDKASWGQRQSFSP